MDGDWEPPLIPNPEYKGEWTQKKIPNPDYKGKWSPPKIPNPEYRPDPSLHAYNTAYIGFDLWQVKSGSIFDNIIITDDIEAATSFAEETFENFRTKEKEAKRVLDKRDAPKKEEESEQPGFEELKEDEDDIIDMDVTFNKEGKVVVSEPDPKNDVPPPIVEQDKDDIKVRDEKDKEGTSEKSTPSSSASEETPSSPISSQTGTTKKDEFDELFEDLEEEIEKPPKRDEL